MQRSRCTCIATQGKCKLGGGFDLADLFPSKKFLHVFTGLKSKLENVHRQVDKILAGMVINDHRENQKNAATGNGELLKEDLVDVLIGLQQSGSLGFPITTNHIKAVSLVIIPSTCPTHSKTINSKLPWLVTSIAIIISFFT